MRRTLLIVLTIVTFCNVKAQKQLLTQTIKGESQINIALDEINKVFTPPPKSEKQLKSGASAGNFIVTYENVPTQAKAAFQYAVSIWEGIVSSPVPVKIAVKWEEKGTNMLAESKPAQFYKNFDGALFYNVFYPVALAEKLAGEDLNGENEPDIICSFNSNISWYFGTDGNTPSSKYDFTTAALHEITHGLGFSGFFKVEDNNGLISNSNKLPSIYDYYIYNFSNQRIADNNNFSSPSKALFQQLTSEQLKFNRETVTEKSATPAPSVYAPANWLTGSSLYHLDNNEFNAGDENSLMTAYKYKGQAIHTPGELTIKMLDEMGWKSVSFDFDVIKDFEETCEKIPLNLGINSEIAFEPASVKIIYSKDYFSTTDSVFLHFDASTQKYTANFPVNFHLGNIQYYFVAQSAEGRTFKLPSAAPNKKLSFRIGPDYAAPTVKHNPVKLISSSLKTLQLKGEAIDNLGIKSVNVEYKVDGVAQEPVSLTVNSENFFSGSVELPDYFQNDNIEYRIIAKDNSKNSNQVIVPSSGYYSVNVFEPNEAVSSYETDFNDLSTDFIGSDFNISNVEGFSSGVLHTNHPYQQSVIENEKCDLVTQLKYPVIVKEYGEMSFKEVVLVEPGEPETNYTDLLFWDYVIVEASKDNGRSWIPLTEGYDSNSDDLWYSSFVNSLKSNSSTTSGDESMFVSHTISLTENTGIQAGDEILIRFRLSSDKSVNGWGWAIDDLKIQSNSFENEEIVSAENIDVYPNPFASNFYVDCSNSNDISAVDIMVTDLTGKTVFRESWTDPQFTAKKQVNLNNIEPGIYLVNMITDASQVITKKIVKY